MNSHVPYARCLRDYLAGDQDARFQIERDDGVTMVREASEFLRSDPDMPAIERDALRCCRGRVLDVGAGAGPHAVWLQENGIEVAAVDFCREVVELLRERGVVEARCCDIYDLAGERFDTILVLGRTIGLAGDPPGLRRLLAHFRGLCSVGGQLLLTSLDVTASPNEKVRAHAQRNRGLGREPGHQHFRFRYGDLVGPWIDWLHIDPTALETAARPSGWACAVAAEQGDGNYLARLTPAIETGDDDLP